MSHTVALLAPTGAGKTAVSIALARLTGGEVVNYDSVQLYRGFDVGSAKPDARERAGVPHHLFDIADADEHVTAAEWARGARETIAQIHARGRLAILVGGTFFYLRALRIGLPEMPPRDEKVRARIRRILQRPRGLDHLRALLRRTDPVSHDRIARNDLNRLERAIEVWLTSGRPISHFTPATDEAMDLIRVELTIDRTELKKRLDERVLRIYESGLIEETRRLLGLHPAEARPFGSIGYREAVRHLRGELSLEQAIEETQRRTRAYAKRQLTWLRSEQGMHQVSSDLSPGDAATRIARIIRETTENS